MTDSNDKSMYDVDQSCSEVDQIDGGIRVDSFELLMREVA